ncbi:MAG: GNAT family N-acetyltransferase, partial [Micromonosporaceae bacterium]
MDTVELFTEDLQIRPWKPSDADAVFRACQDPDIQRWTTVPDPYLAEHAKEFTGVRSPRGWAAGYAAPFGVFDAATDELLGSNGLVSIDRNLGSAEVGYWTAPWARGRGITTQATRAIAAWAFDKLGLKRLIWQAVVGNHASRLAALRCGFRMEGRLRLAEPARDGNREGWVGSLLPDDLRSSPPSDFGADSVTARRAKVFGAAQPALAAGELATGELTLRRPNTRDIEAIVASCRDPEAAKWTTIPHPYQTSDAEFFLRHVAEEWADGAAANFGLYEAADTCCGSIGLRLTADPGVGDLGFLVAPWARGRGYATHAVRTLCQWGFSELGLRR